MVAQKLVLLAAIFAAARSQALVGGELGGPHVARYLRGREDDVLFACAVEIREQQLYIDTYLFKALARSRLRRISA